MNLITLHSLLSILCRCTSCRDDVVTMAAKPREGKRKEEKENKSRTKSNAGKRKKRTERIKREGRGRRREDQRRDERRNADVYFHVASPSNLLSSLHVATDHWVSDL